MSNKKEYIEREAAFAALCEYCDGGACKDSGNSECAEYRKIRLIPAADVEEVRHGTWLPYPSDAYMKCSVCGMEYHKSCMPDVVGYCPNPNCGAKMNGGK